MLSSYESACDQRIRDGWDVSERPTIIWESCLKKFRSAPVDFNFKAYAQKCMNGNCSINKAHYIHSYPAKMFPYIPKFLLSVPQLCSPEGRLLDPLCGSGTVLLESLIHPLYSGYAYGVELNPIGRLVTKVKTTLLEEARLRERIDHLFEQVKKPTAHTFLPNSEKIKFWFSPKAIHELGKLKYRIEKEGPEDKYKDFLWACFSSTVRKVSLADPFIPPPVLLKPDKYKKSTQKHEFLRKFLEHAKNPDVAGSFRQVVEKNYLKIGALFKGRKVMKESKDPQIIWDDAKQIKVGSLGSKGMLVKDRARDMAAKSIDLILTSPPYLTAQKYIRTHRLELLWLEMVSESELPDLERITIGSEKVSMREIDFAEEVEIESIDKLIDWTSSRSPIRAAMLHRYFHEMKKVIIEMHRVLLDEGHAILVLGNNKVLGRPVHTYKHLIDIAIDTGFKVKLVLRDEIRGRGMITKRHNTGGLIKKEFIVVLMK